MKLRRIVAMMLCCAALWPMARLRADNEAPATAAPIQPPQGARHLSPDCRLGVHGPIPANSPIKSYAKHRPGAPNADAEGTDDPMRHPRNRRAEIAVDPCG